MLGVSMIMSAEPCGDGQGARCDHAPGYSAREVVRDGRCDQHERTAQMAGLGLGLDP